MPVDDHDARGPSGYTDREVAQLFVCALDPDSRDMLDSPTPKAAQILHLMRLRRRRARRAALTRYAAVVVAVVVVTGTVWGVTDAYGPTQPAAAPSTAIHPQPRPLSLPNRSGWSPARAQLTALATAVGTLAEPEPSGRFTHTRTRLWARDATDALAPPVTHDEQRWWAPDLSGRQTRSTVFGWLPGQDPGPPLAPDAGQDETYQPGAMPVTAPELSDNVFVVSSQLAERHDPADGPQATLRAVREVYRFHDPNPRQRAALLQALADTDGLQSAGRVDGGVGRRGLAVVVDSENGTVRDVAVFDPDSGRLLAYDTVWLQPPAAVGIPTPAVSDSLLIIESNHTSAPQ